MRPVLKPLLEATPVAVIVVDEQDRVVRVNEPAATLLGYTTGELSGLSFVQLCPRVAEDMKHQCGRSGVSVLDAPRASSGERRMVVASCKNSSGRPVSVQCAQYGPADASPRIVNFVNPCKHEQAHTDDRPSEQLARVSELGEIAAALAHEINQPLTAILSNAQAAQRFLEASTSDPCDLREALTDIVADSFRATEIVRRLRQLVRRSTPESLPLDMGALVRDVTHLMRRNAVARGASVTLDIATHVPKVCGDSIQLQQVMINLLQNAFDAVEGRCAEDRVVSVKIRTAQLGDGVSITVSDRGHGLTADQIGEVFKPFSTSKPHGLGLGLSISRSIVSMHGGRLWGENNDDGGAAFHVLLPSASEVEGSDPR